ncbi:MAG: Ig-like domain-containing protein [Deltaproteobacteria bacterium]|nr:Ig-like domain-containing protein [Deltaproteobacteria bacterium]
MRRTDAHRRSRGFTLTELLITLAISFILMAAVYQFFIRQQHGYSTQEELSRVQQQARTAQDVLVRAIQQAGAYGLNNGGQTISLRGQVVASASDHYLTIQYDDPYRTADLGVITEEEVVTFVVSDEIPSAASGANDWPSDDPAGGSTTVRMWFDQNRAHGVESTEFFDVSVPTTLKGAPYTLYRVTPDKDAPTTASKLHAEPIASGVDNLVFRYFDQNGNPIPRDAATGAAAPPPYVLTPEQRSQVRSIEVELALRTPSKDKAYKADFPVPDFTVATYTAGGTPQTGFTGFNDDGYRRRVFRTRITPRNLSANNCGNLLLYADDAQPRCPLSSTIRATVQNRYGQPVAGIPVNFTSDAGSFTNAAPTTDVNGEVTTTLQYTDVARTIAVSASAIISCAPGGPDKYTLVSSLPISFVPGDSRDVHLMRVLPTPEILTCPAPEQWQAEATTFDACGNSVTPLLGLWLHAVDPISGAPFGTLDGAAQVELAASPQVFTVKPPTAGPYTVSKDGLGKFTQEVTFVLPKPAWFGSWLPLSAGEAEPKATIKPWPPHEIFHWTNTFAATPFDDCSQSAKADTFEVLDCLGNQVYQMEAGGPRVTASLRQGPLVTDPLAPATWGSLSSTNNGPPGSSIDIVTGAVPPLYNVTYTTPQACSLSPQLSMPAVLNPNLFLNFTAAPGAVDPSPDHRTLTLNRCTSCDIVANPATMTECAGQTTITVSGCSLNGQTVELEVTGSGSGNGKFASSGTSTALLTLTGNLPSTATDILRLGTAQDGDELTVRAYYPKKLGALWQCDPIKVRVSSECQKLEIFADANLSKPVGNAQGYEDCLSRIQDLYFKVQDCQDPGVTTLRKAVTVYAIAQNGTWLDKETIDLVPHIQTANGAVTVWRSLHNVTVVQSSGYHLDGDGALQYPPGYTIQILAEYKDVNDPTERASTLFQDLTAPVPMPVATKHRCQQLVTLAVPLPICFPNAITSGGGGSWNGNYQVHWGDVVIRGDADPASTPKRIEKLAGAALDGSSYSGSGNSDRFFDLYVGFSNAAGTAGGNLAGAAPDTSLQPFRTAGYGNYFQRISYNKITEMMATLDYDTMKQLARDRGVYWYTLSNGTIRNPSKNLTADLETVLSLSNPGVPNAYHDGKFIFVDIYGTVDPGPTTTGANVMLSPTPTFALNGIYTEGIIFVAGSLEYKSGGNGRNIAIQSPPSQETNINTNNVLTEDDLPIRPLPSAAQLPITLTDINVNGGVYAKGTIQFSGSPKIFGAVTAEQGFLGNGTPEIWYNYNLNVSDQNTALCVYCCTLDLTPGSATLRIGDTTTLQAIGAAGQVQWVSENDPVASVSSSGVVTAKAAGTARIKAVDQNNCPSWTTITVLSPCTGFAVTPSSATVGFNGTQTFTASPVPAGSSIQWYSSDPAVASVLAVGSSTTATGLAVPSATTITVNAHDANGICPNASALLTVNPPSCTIGSVTVSPTSETVGQALVQASITGTARGSLTWSSTAPATVNPSGLVTGVAPGTATITATDSFFTGGTCKADTSVTINCGLTISGPATVQKAHTIQLTASGGVAPITWDSSQTNRATVTSPANPTTVTGGNVNQNRTVTITATDSQGCTKSVSITVTP